MLFVGLGNPGERYSGHRHNIGFMAVDAIHDRYRFGPWRSRFQAQVAEGTIAGTKVLVMKPQTFMNESGRAVGEALRFFKLQSGDVVVFHDELDLAPGKLRARAGGGTAGHNGLKSLAAHIGANFRRVRIGIGHPGDKERVLGHVLSDFSKSDEEWVAPLMTAIAEAAAQLAAGEEGRFMNKVAVLTQGRSDTLSPATSTESA